MGKGDQKTRRGKLFAGSYGKRRPRKKKKTDDSGLTKSVPEAAPRIKTETKPKAETKAKAASKSKAETKTKAETKPKTAAKKKPAKKDEGKKTDSKKDKE